MNGCVWIGNGCWMLRDAKKWLKQGRIKRIPGKLEWVFADLPKDAKKRAAIENLAVRIGNNVAGLINKQIEQLVRFTHDPHAMTDGEKSFRTQQRGGELYDLCVKKVMEEFNNPGTPFSIILAEMDMQE